MYLSRLRQLTKLYFHLILHRFQYFKSDTIIELASELIFSIGNILFWYFVTEVGYELQGWTLNNIILFIAYSELFFSIDSSIFGMTSRFWRVIYSGNLDTFLTTPMDPRLRFGLLNIKLSTLINGVIKFIVLLTISKADISFLKMVISILITLIAAFNLGIIRLVLSYLAFWMGKMEVVSEVADSIGIFNKYPLVILPKVVKLVFGTVVPFYFFSTFQVEFILHKITLSNKIFGVLGLIFNTILWLIINNVIWRKGRERYEGING